MGFRGIPPLDWWKFLTTPATKTFLQKQKPRRDQMFEHIDRTLKNYWDFVSVEFDKEKEKKTAKKRYETLHATRLLDIHRETKEWVDGYMKLSKTVSKEKKKRLSKKPYLWVVGNLMTNAAGCAEHLTGDPSTTAGRLRWKMMRQDLKKLGLVGKSGSGKLKSLDKSYWLEANLGGANPQHFEGSSIAKKWGKSGEKSFFMYMRRHKKEIEQKQTKVLYVKKKHLWKYTIVFKGGRLYRIIAPSTKSDRLSHKAITCKGWLFIIDSKGNCYASMERKKSDATAFHHSSIPAGAAVKFAGAIDATNGILTVIDNGSGHFKPKRKHFLQALQILEGHDVNLSKVQAVELVMIQGPGDQLMPSFKMHKSAKTFREELKKEDKKVRSQLKLKTKKTKKDEEETDIISII